MSRRPRTSWIEVMPKAAAMVEAAVGRGDAVTASRLFYMLEAARLIPNDETAYKGVLRETAVRRRRREFPRLDDPGREVNGGGGWSGPEAFVDDLLQQTKGYQRNRTDGQREQTWIVTEKATVDLLARRWYADRSLYVVGLRGYWSVALVEDVAKLMALDGRPAFAPGEPSRERFAEWLETWWRREAATWAASTRMERGYRIDRWIEPYLGQVRLADLGPGRVRDWRAAILADGASAHTANAAKSILSSILGAAVSDGRLPANPVLGIRDLPHAVSRPTALTPLQIERIRAAMPSDRDVVMVRLMAYAGLRPGEVAALTWGSIGRRLTVDRAYSHGELKGTKTHQRRSVAIPPPLADDLARHREQVEGDPAHLVAPALGRPGWRSRNPDLATAYLHPGNWRNRSWAPACEAAGVRATPYDLRHSYASLLFHEGQGIREVMLAMGHDSPTTTERHYLHIYEEARLAPRVGLAEAALAARASVAGLTTGPVRDQDDPDALDVESVGDENPLA